MMLSGYRTKAFISAAALLLSAALVQAQSARFTRAYTPAILVIGETAIAGATIDSLALFKFDAASSAWTPIPFQVDELDGSGNFLREQDGIADENDELVFMMRDAGDKATDQFAPAGVNVSSRYEIAMQDPLDAGRMSWVYLFMSGSPPSPPGYLDYTPDAGGMGADTVKGASYVLGHGSSGWLDYASILGPTGAGPDILDRQKLRVKGNADLGFLKFPYEANEEASLVFDSISVEVGPVRLLRTLFLKLDPLRNGTVTFDISLQFLYYAYSSAVGADDATIPDDQADLAGVELVRQSMDLSAEAMGMTFFSDSDQSGLPIDGSLDPFGLGLPVSPDLALLVASGTQGLFINVVEVPAIGDSQVVYYRDDSASSDTNDGTEDTGDLVSYGDMGVMIGGNKLRGQVSFDLFNYFLAPSQMPYQKADTLRTEIANPPIFSVVRQDPTATSVGDGPELPGDFRMEEPYPNPFQPGSQALRIGFESGAAARDIRISVYNLLGQEVRRLENVQTAGVGRFETIWDGRDRLGQLVPGGVYFYVLETTGRKQVKKFLLLH